MIFGMTFYQICWYFMIYSFGGWIVEVIFHAVTQGKVINRGFLNGPICPVYGFGILTVFAAVNTVQSAGLSLNGIWIFVFGISLATIVELLAGWLLDICFHARWWDYSDKPLNLHGYICLEFSIIWGMAIVFIVKVFHHTVEHNAVHNISQDYGWFLLALIYLVGIADFGVTVAILLGLNKKLHQLDLIREDMRKTSDKISELVGNRTIITAQKVEEGKVQAALGRKEALQSLRERETVLQKRFEEISESMTSQRWFGTGHLLRAFPNMKHRVHPEIIDILQDRIEKKLKEIK